MCKEIGNHKCCQQKDRKKQLNLLSEIISRLKPGISKHNYIIELNK